MYGLLVAHFKMVYNTSFEAFCDTHLEDSQGTSFSSGDLWSAVLGEDTFMQCIGRLYHPGMTVPRQRW